MVTVPSSWPTAGASRPPTPDGSEVGTRSSSRRERDAHGHLPRRLHAARPTDVHIAGSLTALTAERARLLTEIIAREAELRTKQAAYDQARRAVGKTPGQGKKPLVAIPDEKWGELAMLQSERAYVDGTVGRDRESAQIADAIWNTCHDPETFGSGDW
jgi:hypothetical protein